MLPRLDGLDCRGSVGCLGCRCRRRRSGFIAAPPYAETSTVPDQPDMPMRRDPALEVSVILSASEDPAYLAKAIWGYFKQSYQDFEIVVADSGHGPDPSHCLQRLRCETALTIHHLRDRSPDGRRCAILNRAIEHATGAYLVFSEDRCIPRWDLLEVHTRLARPGLFLSGGYVPLQAQLTRLTNREEIVTGRATDSKWLKENGLVEDAESQSLPGWRCLGGLWEYLFGSRAVWNSANASCWKAHLLEVNGFDERIEHGTLDRELGERLHNLGVRGKGVRHRAVCIRLHSRPQHLPREALERNLALSEETRRTRSTWTPFGIRKGYRVFGLEQDASPATELKRSGRAVA